MNLRGALLVSQAVLPHMIKRKYGRILHVASIAGKEGNAGMTAYSATKARPHWHDEEHAKDSWSTGVTVNALAPAVISTAMVDALPPAQVNYMTEKIPMKTLRRVRGGGQAGRVDRLAGMQLHTGFTFDLTGGRATY